MCKEIVNAKAEDSCGMAKMQGIRRKRMLRSTVTRRNLREKGEMARENVLEPKAAARHAEWKERMF